MLLRTQNFPNIQVYYTFLRTMRQSWATRITHLEKKCRYVCETGESEKNVRAATCCLYTLRRLQGNRHSLQAKTLSWKINSQFTHWWSCHSWSYHRSFQYVSRHCVSSNQLCDHDEEEDDGVVVDEKCVLQFGLSHTKSCWIFVARSSRNGNKLLSHCSIIESFCISSSPCQHSSIEV